MGEAKQFIVVYDSGDGACWPMGWDRDCKGALCALLDHVAIFGSRAAARTAIKISTAYAKLCVAQGQIGNGDFIEGIKNVRIVPCVPATPESAG